MSYHKYDGEKIHIIIKRLPCKRHSALVGEPCWGIYSHSANKWLPAVCGSRIAGAGFVGSISAQSLRSKGAQTRFERKRRSNYV